MKTWWAKVASLSKWTKTPPLAATCWFIAWHEAEQFLDLRTKDVACMIQDGDRIGGPYLTEADVEAWLTDRYDTFLDEAQGEYHAADIRFEETLNEELEGFFMH